MLEDACMEASHHDGNEGKMLAGSNPCFNSNLYPGSFLGFTFSLSTINMEKLVVLKFIKMYDRF